MKNVVTKRNLRILELGGKYPIEMVKRKAEGKVQTIKKMLKASFLMLIAGIIEGYTFGQNIFIGRGLQ